MRKEQ
jgi:hypothetical protein